MFTTSSAQPPSSKSPKESNSPLSYDTCVHPPAKIDLNYNLNHNLNLKHSHNTIIEICNNDYIQTINKISNPMGKSPLRCDANIHQPSKITLNTFPLSNTCGFVFFNFANFYTTQNITNIFQHIYTENSSSLTKLNPHIFMNISHKINLYSPMESNIGKSPLSCDARMHHHGKVALNDVSLNTHIIDNTTLTTLTNEYNSIDIYNQPFTFNNSPSSPQIPSNEFILSSSSTSLPPHPPSTLLPVIKKMLYNNTYTTKNIIYHNLIFNNYVNQYLFSYIVDQNHTHFPKISNIEIFYNNILIHSIPFKHLILLYIIHITLIEKYISQTPNYIAHNENYSLQNFSILPLAIFDYTYYDIFSHNVNLHSPTESNIGKSPITCDARVHNPSRVDLNSNLTIYLTVYFPKENKSSLSCDTQQIHPTTSSKILLRNNDFILI